MTTIVDSKPVVLEPTADISSARSVQGNTVQDQNRKASSALGSLVQAGKDLFRDVVDTAKFIGSLVKGNRAVTAGVAALAMVAAFSETAQADDNRERVTTEPLKVGIGLQPLPLQDMGDVFEGLGGHPVDTEATSGGRHYTPGVYYEQGGFTRIKSLRVVLGYTEGRDSLDVSLSRKLAYVWKRADFENNPGDETPGNGGASYQIDFSNPDATDYEEVGDNKFPNSDRKVLGSDGEPVEGGSNLGSSSLYLYDFAIPDTVTDLNTGREVGSHVLCEPGQYVLTFQTRDSVSVIGSTYVAYAQTDRLEDGGYLDSEYRQFLKPAGGYDDPMREDTLEAPRGPLFNDTSQVFLAIDPVVERDSERIVEHIAESVGKNGALDIKVNGVGSGGEVTLTLNLNSMTAEDRALIADLNAVVEMSPDLENWEQVGSLDTNPESGQISSFNEYRADDECHYRVRFKPKI